MSKCKQITITTLLKQQQAEIKSIIHLIEENLEPIKIDCQEQSTTMMLNGIVTMFKIGKQWLIT